MTDVAAAPVAPSRPARAADTRPLTSRESIFAAATQLFGDLGYHGASMRDIAKAVGILPGSLYAHIDSKEAVLLEIIESAVDKYILTAERVDRLGYAAPEALRELIRAHLAIVAENPERTRIVFHQWRCLSPENRRLLLEKRRRYADYFRHLIRSGVEAGEFREGVNEKVAVLTILGALNWTPEWFDPDGPRSSTEVADEIADSLIAGLVS